MAIRFDGRVAVVTGAGGGLGRSHALEFAKRGAKVVVNDFGGAVDGSGGSPVAAEAVAAEIRAAGGEAIANGGSVTSDEDVAGLVRQTLDAFGRVDIVVNNAGVLRDRSFSKMSMADFAFVVDVHLVGSARVSQAFWGAMKDQHYGRVVLTTSAAGMFGNFGQANYGAAKMGLLGLMNVLRLEGARDDIRVNALAPVAATRMTATTATGQERAADPHMDPHVASAGLMVLAGEDAPNGVVLCAVGGSYSLYRMGDTPGVFVGLGEGLTAEMVQAAMPQISDVGAGLISSPQAGEHAMRLMGLGA